MPLTKIQSLGITDGTIVNADINASAAIAGTKLSGAGKVLQVVQTAKTDTFSYTGSGDNSPETFSDITGLSLSITPSSSSNKILIMFTVLGASQNDSFISIFRNSTNLASPTSPSGRTPSFAGDYDNLVNAAKSLTYSASYLDSPSTTSAITYKLAGTVWGANTFYINRSINDVDGGYQTRSISTITAMEIAG